MTDQENRYRAFMLRLYRVGASEQPDWRASLEDPHTGERHGFATLSELLDFLFAYTDQLRPVGLSSSPHENPDIWSEP